MENKPSPDHETAMPDAANNADNAPNTEMPDELAPPPLKPFAGTSTSASRSAFHPDVPGRVAGIPGMPQKPVIEPAPKDRVEPKRLVVGREIHLQGGEISSCERLTLEGCVEDTTLIDARLLDVAREGRFKGKAEVNEAIIAGKFEGHLVVRGRLTVRESGSISGSVRYGSIVIEPGGQISGEMLNITNAGAPNDPQKH